MSIIETEEDMQVYLSSLIYQVEQINDANISEDEKKIRLIKLANEVMRDAATS